jgi:hypothetical protein
MEKEELLKELRKQFDLTKEKLKFKTSFEDINALSYIEDMVLSEKAVSNQFSRQLINRMIDGPFSWINELYSWLYPAPTDIIRLNEGKTLTQDERKEIHQIIEKIMYFARKNKRMAFEGLEDNEEGRFVDEIMDFKQKMFKPFMAKYLKRFENLWDKGV